MSEQPPPQTIRGVGVARRGWKEVQTQRTSAMKRPGALKAAKGVRSAAFSAALASKRARAEARAISMRLKGVLAAEKEALRTRRLENAKRRSEGILRGTQFTTVTDAKTLKKMNKRQLRQVQKTVVDKHGNTQLVPLWGSGGGKAKGRR